MRLMTTAHGNHIKYAENFERQIREVRYTENKMGKTKAKFFTLVFLLEGATTFTTFSQVLSSMNVAFFGTTQDISGNPNLVTKLITLILGCTKSTFARIITGQFTPGTLPIIRIAIYWKHWATKYFFIVGFLFEPNKIYISHISKKVGFIQIKLKVMRKTSIKSRGKLICCIPSYSASMIIC